MSVFSYSITDLGEYESDLYEVALESNDEALAFGSRIAREMLERMPDLTSRGWCITVYDSQRGRISIVPIDAVN